MKLTFEIEVQEDLCRAVNGTAGGQCLSDAASTLIYEGLGDGLVKLDPAEHQAFKWVTEDELKLWGPGKIVTEEQRQMMLQAFEVQIRVN